MTVFEMASIAGLILGPVAGAWIAFKLQDRALVRNRQLDVFRILMRTRRTPLNPDHVGALNLVEIDFSNHRSVLTAHKQLFDSFSKPLARLESEIHAPTDSDSERLAKDNAFALRQFGDRQHLLAKLLFSMGKALGYRLEQLDILEGGYHPTYHANLEQQQEALRLFLMSIAKGEQSFPVRVVGP